MPVRPSNSRVRRWPDAEMVLAPVRAWAADLGGSRRDIVRIGYIGSYARGDWGVGSDLDLVIVLDETRVPFHERAREFHLPRFLVPVDLLIYSHRKSRRFWLKGDVSARF